MQDDPVLADFRRSSAYIRKKHVTSHPVQGSEQIIGESYENTEMSVLDVVYLAFLAFFQNLTVPERHKVKSVWWNDNV